MKVKDAMHAGVSWIDPGAPLSDIAEQMRKDDIGSLPVGEDDRLVGMVTDRDLVLRGLGGKDDPLHLTARDVMSKPIIYCTANEDLEDAVRITERKQIRRLPVIDENHRMIGMLSLGDIAAKASASVAAETMRAVSAHHG